MPITTQNPYEAPASVTAVAAAKSIPTLLRLPVRVAGILYLIWLIALISVGGTDLVVQDLLPIACIGLAGVGGVAGSWLFATRTKWRTFVLLWGIAAALPVLAIVYRTWSQSWEIFGIMYLSALVLCILTAVGFCFRLQAHSTFPEPAGG